MNQTYLEPATVIESLKESLDNLTVHKSAGKAPAKTASAATFHNLRIKVGGKAMALVVNVKRQMPVHRGVPNPLDETDQRNAYSRSDTGNVKEVLKVQFNLADPVLSEMIQLIEAAYMKRVAELGEDATYGHIVHTLYDLGRPLEHKNNKKALSENPHAYQEEFKYEYPRFSAKLKFTKCSDKHFIAARRGKPESEIFDFNRPKIIEGKVVGCEPATVDGQELSAENAYKFINDGAVFVAQRWEFSAIVVSTAYISLPVTVIWASVKTGENRQDDSDMYEGYIPSPVEAKPEAISMPTSKPRGPVPIPITGPEDQIDSGDI